MAAAAFFKRRARLLKAGGGLKKPDPTPSTSENDLTA
jgi:hypothetical protein